MDEGSFDVFVMELAGNHFSRGLRRFRIYSEENRCGHLEKGGSPYSRETDTNSLIIIMTTSICKIPPNLPLQREEFPLFGKEGRGEIFHCLCQFNFETLNNITERRQNATVG